MGVEALLRWRHPKLGTILPAELLPDRPGRRHRRRTGRVGARRGLPPPGELGQPRQRLLAVGERRPKELLTARFPERVAATLEKHDADPERLVVEVAETWIAEDVPAIVAALTGLRKLGVRAALDDFGAGQASLSHLRRLPVDMLKLDRALVNTPTEPAVGPAVIDVVVSLGRRLGLEIVAKGLETEERDRARPCGRLPVRPGLRAGPPRPGRAHGGLPGLHRS